MQELVLILPGRTAEKEFAHEAAAAALRREFEERLAECGPLAYRVARGVLRNSADAEDVAQEAAAARVPTVRSIARSHPISRVAGAHRVSAGDRSCTFIEAARSARNALVAIGAAAFDGRHGCDQRISGTSRSRHGRASGETSARASAGGDAGAFAGRSGGDARSADWNGEVEIVFCQKAVSGEIAMPCENYREALIDAAAADSAPSRELRSHLEACVSCRAAFTEEVQLFASIDTGVRATANSEMPASLLPRVRAELNARPTPQRSWIPVVAALAAAAALVVAIVSVRGFGRGAVETNPPMIAATHNGSPAVIQPSTQAAAPSETTSAPAKIRSVRPVEPTSFAEIEEIKVLIPAGQKQAIDALLVSVQQGKVEADVLLTEKPTGTLEELQVPPLVISPIEVKPLADAYTESGSPN